jgi:inorganic pyrophosphatase
MKDHDFSRWRPHPWHGLDVGPDAPRVVNAYIEITPFDMIKYEIDKASGYLRVDRPQRSSSHPPALYGFIPRTYCGARIAGLAPGCERGDGDPLDICVISERPIERNEVLLRARVIGGLKLIDRGEADDKIIAVLEGDGLYGGWRELSDIPNAVVMRLVHYFETYKLAPGATKRPTEITQVFGRDDAHEIIQRSREDYSEKFGEVQHLAAALRGC